MWVSGPGKGPRWRLIVSSNKGSGDVIGESKAGNPGQDVPVQHPFDHTARPLAAISPYWKRDM
jgi:hypothetical protein